MARLSNVQPLSSASPKKRVTVLGSTGSIGKSTIDLISANPDKFEVIGLTAGKNADLVAEQARTLNARYVALSDPRAYARLKELLADTNIEIMAGDDAVADIAARPADWVMSAIVGAAGLKPTLAAVRQGRTVALANKECIVCGGDFVMGEVARHKATLLPVDSEHNAVFQVFNEAQREHIDRIILTASGGPFLGKSRDELRNVTPEQAVAHPNWSMGAKISVDSATMMNKALEVIEASYLFSLKSEKIDVSIHPQSIIHAIVEYKDGSMLAQMGAPDMRTPIAVALAWPERMETTGKRLDLTKNINLSLYPVDLDRFKAISLVRQVLKTGGSAPIIFNAANELAVAAFLDRKIRFTDIEDVVERVLEEMPPARPEGLEAILEIDIKARALAGCVLNSLK